MLKRVSSLSLVLALLFLVLDIQAKDPIKVLAIGNSFTEDAIEQNLWNMAEADGMQMIIGNMYIPGCSLEMHAKNARENAASYEYRKIGLDGVLKNTLQFTLDKALADEEWDYISVQQVSGLAGVYETFHPFADELVAYVKAHAPKKCKLLFHQTWAYQEGAKHGDFKRYDNSQWKMFDDILNTERKVMKEIGIKKVVPSGTAVQNVRGTWMGDHLNRDGYHMNYQYGRYIIACVWFEVLTHHSVIGNSYLPEGVSRQQQTTIQQSAHQAVRKPWKTTTSR